MPDGKRLWRTESGELVEEGHADAVSLAYGIDDSLSAEDAKLLAAKKVAKPAANKGRTSSETKGH